MPGVAHAALGVSPMTSRISGSAIFPLGSGKESSEDAEDPMDDDVLFPVATANKKNPAPRLVRELYGVGGASVSLCHTEVLQIASLLSQSRYNQRFGKIEL